MSDNASLMQQPAPPADVGLQRELANLFVDALNLDVAPEDIDPIHRFMAAAWDWTRSTSWRSRYWSPSNTASSYVRTVRKTNKYFAV